MVLPLALGREVMVVGFTPSSLLREEPLGRGGRVRQRQGFMLCERSEVANEALTALDSLAGFKGHRGEPVE